MFGKTKICLLLLFSILLCYALMIPGNAIATELITEDLGAEQIEGLFASFEVERIEEQEVSVGFSCFDINDQGDYALGFSFPSKDYIQVFDANSNYKYGYQFNCQGAFCIGLEVDSFVIYDVRSELAVHINENGECCEIKCVPVISENISYRHQIMDARKKVGHNVTYMAEHSMSNSESVSFGTYPRLTRTDVDGKVTILFETKDYQGTIFAAAFLFLIIAMFAGGIVVLCIAKRKRNKIAWSEQAKSDKAIYKEQE